VSVVFFNFSLRLNGKVLMLSWLSKFVTFRVSRRRREMYIGHARLCVCVCLPLATFPHYYTDADVAWGMVGVPSSCALLGGFATVHGFRCYDNIVRTRIVSECS